MVELAVSVQIQVPHGPVQYLQQWTILNFLDVHQSQDSVCSLKSIKSMIFHSGISPAHADKGLLALSIGTTQGVASGWS